MLRNFLYIVFLFSADALFGQVTLLSAVDDKELRVNEPFRLTVVLEVSGAEYVQESGVKLPDLSKFNYIGNASDQNTFVDPAKNILVNQIIYQVTLQAKKSGKYKIGSALVQINGKMYKTEPFDVMVKDADRKPAVADRKLDNPYLDVEIRDRDVYKNQPTVAVLRAYSGDFNDFRKLSKVRFSTQQNLKIWPVSFDKSEIEPSVGQRPASQVIAVFLIFPKESGRLELNPVSAEFKDAKAVKLLSKKTALNVKKLPQNAPANFHDAVGKFTVELNAENGTRPEIEKPMKVVLKVAGAGNFGLMQIPKLLKSNAYTFFSPKIKSDTRIGESGLEGTVSAQYILIPKKAGNLEIKTEKFSYFNPETQHYEDLGHEILSVDVLTPEEISDSKTTMERVNEYTNTVFKKVGAPVLQAKNFSVEKNERSASKAFQNFAWLCGAISVALLLLFRFKKNKTTKPSNTSIPAGVPSSVSAAALPFLPNLNGLSDAFYHKNYKEFFRIFDDSVVDLEAFAHQRNMTTKELIENILGAGAAEKFFGLRQKVNVEKFSPLQSEQQMAGLHEEAVNLLSAIKDSQF